MEKHFLTRRCIKVGIKTTDEGVIPVDQRGEVWERAVLLMLDDEIFTLSGADAMRIGLLLEDAGLEARSKF